MASCGDLRVWPAAGQQAGRKGGHAPRGSRRVRVIEVPVAVTNLKLNYTVRLKGDALRVTVDLDKPLDPKVVGGGAFRLDLYPSAYFGKTFHIQDTTGVFPREPNQPLRGTLKSDRRTEPLGRGRLLTFAPEDPALRMTIEGVGCELELMDNRKRGQEEWFAVSSRIPAGKTAGVVEWLVTPNRIEGWIASWRCTCRTAYRISCSRWPTGAVPAGRLPRLRAQLRGHYPQRGEALLPARRGLPHD